MNLSDTVVKIFNLIPKAIIPTTEDEAIITKHKKLLSSYEDALIEGFLEIIAETDDNITQFSIKSNKLREQALREWYQLTITGNFDAYYWNWQVLAGIEHVKENIPNTLMLTMRGWTMSFFQKNLLKDLELSEALEVLTVLQKLQSVSSSLTVASSVMTRREAIRLASGLNETILSRLIGIEINKLMLEGQTQITIDADIEKMVA